MTSVESYMNEDAVVAAVELAARGGARGVTFGFLHEGVPVEEAGWYMEASWQGTRLFVGDHRSPTTAALAFAERMLTRASCKCGQQITLSDDAPGCRWRLMGKTWTPSCTAAPILVKGGRGDLTAMAGAYYAAMNRRDRRKAKRGKRGN